MHIESSFGNIPRKITLEDLEASFSYGFNEEVSKYVTWNTHRTISNTKGFVEIVLVRYEEKRVAPIGIEYKEGKQVSDPQCGKASPCWGTGT